MRIKKSLVIAGAVTTVGLAGIGGAGLASAQPATEGGGIKQKVQAVFDEEKAAHTAQREKKFSDRLQKAVDKGDLTAEQKAAIEQKQDELKREHEATRESLKQWAKDNNIDAKYLMGGSLHKHHDSHDQANT